MRQLLQMQTLIQCLYNFWKGGILVYTILVNDDNTFALGYTPYTPTEVDNKIDDLDFCIITNNDIDSIFSENS